MQNKDLKHIQDHSGESLGESIAAFVVGGAAYGSCVGCVGYNRF